MGGLLVLLLAGLYLWIAYVTIRKVPKAWGKVLALVVAVLIPTADAVYGRIKLRQMCEAEGGLKIYRKVDGVEGLHMGKLSPTPEWITKYGFRFVEGESHGSKPMRLGRGTDGNLVEERNVVLRSRYRYEDSGGNIGNGYSYDEQRIRDLQTNEILARARNIGYEGGWVERQVAGLYAAKGFAGACMEGAEIVLPSRIVTETLKPAN